jgi:mRNA interferase RelE/StbE
MYEVVFTKSAQKYIQKQDTNTRKRIRKAIIDLAEDPYDNITNDIKLLKGKTKVAYRLRVGNFRVIYRLKEKHLIINILEIDSRGQIYK